jgi:hypothetical protein
MLWVIGLLVTGYDPAWSPEAIEVSKARGDQIAQGLASFQREHGHYPENLSELIPGYLSEIPLPTAGAKQWRYANNDAQVSYSLTFSDEHDNEKYRFASSMPPQFRWQHSSSKSD